MKYQGKNIIGQYLGTQSIVRKYLGTVLFWENVSEPEYRADIIATYNVTSTTTSSALVNSLSPTTIEAMWIDGVYNNPSDVEYLGDYKFPTTGEHTVVYKLYDNTTVPKKAFNTISRLTKVELANTIKSIESEAFMYCSNLVSVKLSDSLTSINSQAFSYCTSLSEITLPESITSIGSSAFSSCKSLPSIDIPESVTNIGSFAFAICTSLTDMVIPSGVTSINTSVFASSSLQSIQLPNTITSIGNKAFNDCRNLTSITIPSGVTFIPLETFGYCTSLKEITALSPTAPELGEDAFEQVPSSVTLYYPCGSDYSSWLTMIGCEDTCGS